MNWTIFGVAFLCAVTITSADSSSPKYVTGRIESCPGCSLNRLPDVKKFVYEDLPKYDGIEFKKIHGAPPELVLFDGADEEVERLPLSSLSRKECNSLLESKGFKLKADSKLEL